ncbi:MAG: transposase, partial [Firmicutes bacterium]|nr:transposase [Bacillota bacterium]
MADELVEKNLAERLWALFEELLDAVVHAIADSGAVDLPQFKRSPEYATLKTLFEESFLGHQ